MKEKKVIDSFLLINIFIFLFLWGFLYLTPEPFPINIKLIIISLFSFTIFNLLNFSFFKEILSKFFLLFTIILLHKIFGDYFTQSFLILDYILLFFLFNIIIFCYLKSDFINQNLEKLIYLMIFLVFIYLIIEWIFGPVPLKSKMIDCNLGWFYNRKLFYLSQISDIKQNLIIPLLFSENSHFGMIAVPIIIYLTIRTFKKENLNYKSIMIFIITVLIFGMVISTTYLTMISFISILTLLFSKTNKFQKIVLLFLVFYGIISISINYQCSSRLYDTALNLKRNIIKSAKEYIIEKEKRSYYANFDLQDTKEMIVSEPLNLEKDEKINNLEKDEKINTLITLLDKIDLKTDNAYYKVIQPLSNNDRILQNAQNNPLNLSSEVFLHSTEVMIRSLNKNIYGYGFNNYIDAFEYNKEPENYRKIVEFLNKKDASGNFVKILVEYGIFSLLFLCIIILYSRLKTISLENKLFFISIILTQLLRGAGYFNGGFIFAVSIILACILQNKKNYK